jgi:hypothetical protein
MATLEELKLQVVNRPGTILIPQKEVLARLQQFSGNSSDSLTLGEGNIVGIRPEDAIGTKQVINGNTVDVFQVPILMWRTGATKPAWKMVSIKALFRKSADVPYVGSILDTQTFTKDIELLEFMKSHVGAGDENATALPAKSIRVEVTPIETEYNGQKGTMKIHGLFLVG